MIVCIYLLAFEVHTHVLLTVILRKMGYPTAPSSLFFRVFQERTSGIINASFYGMTSLLVTQPTLSKHQTELPSTEPSDGTSGTGFSLLIHQLTSDGETSRPLYAGTRDAWLSCVYYESILLLQRSKWLRLWISYRDKVILKQGNHQPSPRCCLPGEPL